MPREPEFVPLQLDLDLPAGQPRHTPLDPAPFDLYTPVSYLTRLPRAPVDDPAFETWGLFVQDVPREELGFIRAHHETTPYDLFLARHHG